MKKISILSRKTSASIMFALEIAKLSEALGNTTCIVPDTIIQETLHQYRFDLVEISGINLYSNLDEVEDNQVCIYHGYLDDADTYIIVVEHDLFYIKSLETFIEDKVIDNPIGVLINANDSKRSWDYILNYHLKPLEVKVENRYIIPVDEIDLEKQLESQINGEIKLYGFSKEKQSVFESICKKVFNADEAKAKDVRRMMKKRG